MSTPNPTEAGLPVSADAINRLASEQAAAAIGYGKHALVHRRGNGTLLFRPSTGLRPAARVARTTCPFTMAITSSGVTRTVTFRAGTINSLLPSNYLTGVTVPASGTRYIVLDVTVVSGSITAAAFAADSAVPGAIAPLAGEPPTSFKVLIGVSINAQLFRVWGCGNIQALPVEAFRLQKVTPVAGQVPYDVYYTWSLAVL